jgi:hypothetical protein
MQYLTNPHMQRTKFIPTPIEEELFSEWQSEQSIFILEEPTDPSLTSLLTCDNNGGDDLRPEPRDGNPYNRFDSPVKRLSFV